MEINVSAARENTNVAPAAGVAARVMTLPAIIDTARSMVVPGRRRILGLTGAPGAGKTTVCTALVDALGADAVAVGMDGFHLSNRELHRLGRAGRKGAPDTFYVAGYEALLRRLRAWDQTVYAPIFDRSIEESIAGAIPIFAGVPLVVTEGNYLLLEDPAWIAVRAAIDEVWFLDVPDQVRRDRFGHSPEAAREWVDTVDQANGALVDATRNRADLVIELAPTPDAP
jgi:pantothenate kinase